MKEIYEIIRDLREDHDLKQKDVADFLKMSRTTYNHYELGHSSFTADMIVDLARLFETTPNVILGFEAGNEVTDTELLRLCKFVQDEKVDVGELIELMEVAKRLF